MTLIKKERRWLKSVLAASESPEVAMPWQRGARRKPQALKAAAPVSGASQSRAAR